MSYKDGELTVFKDGNPERSQKLEIAMKGDEAALGRHWWSGGRQSSTRFIGALDDIRIYERALDGAQIKRLNALQRHE